MSMVIYAAPGGALLTGACLSATVAVSLMTLTFRWVLRFESAAVETRWDCNALPFLHLPTLGI